VAAKEGGVTFFTFFRPGTEVRWEQESLNDGSGFGSTQTIILSAEDPVDPGTTEAAFDATTYMILERAKQGLYPAVDLLRSTARLLDPAVVGQRHYDVAQGVRELLRRAYQWEVAGAGAQLGEDDRRLLARARKIDRFFTQPFYIAEPYTKKRGEYVRLEETVQAFADLLDGKYDDLPEDAFLYCGAIDQAVEKAKGKVG
jgi:F-type H+-transporting ATPase subunit beta